MIAFVGYHCPFCVDSKICSWILPLVGVHNPIQGVSTDCETAFAWRSYVNPAGRTEITEIQQPDFRRPCRPCTSVLSKRFQLNSGSLARYLSESDTPLVNIGRNCYSL